MTRQYPPELHIGQRILVRPNPTTHPLDAWVEAIDTLKGLIHFQLKGHKGLYAAPAHAITNMDGLYLHFKDCRFFFSKDPYLP